MGRTGILRRSLTRIHSLDSDRRVTADGEAKAVFAPRDSDLEHSPASYSRVFEAGKPLNPPPAVTFLSTGTRPEKEPASLSLLLSETQPRDTD